LWAIAELVKPGGQQSIAAFRRQAESSGRRSERRTEWFDGAALGGLRSEGSG
jgi:hypothetical protein